MKKYLLLIAIVCFIGLLIVRINVFAQDKSMASVSNVEKLPVSLVKFYPPKNPVPEYTISMLGLAKSFTDAVNDIMGNDINNAKSSFAIFKKLYSQNSKMIPEWSDKYSIQTLDKIESSLNKNDLSTIMPLIDEIGATCHNCHIKYMAPVQQNYRWDSFEEVSVFDPLSEQEVPLPQMMMMMESNFEAIGTSIERGNKENAKRQLDGFSARFQSVAEACMTCHDSERYYYVSDDILEMINKIGGELDKAKPSIEIISELKMSIGTESCSKCHLVHIPAAYAQLSMKTVKSKQ